MNRLSTFCVAAYLFSMVGFGSGTADVIDRGPFDLTICHSGRHVSNSPIQFDDAHAAWSFRADGPTQSNIPGGPFNMMWTDCVGGGGLIEGKRYLELRCEYIDTEGDKFFVDQSYTVEVSTSKILASKFDLLVGSGKYLGIQGSGDYLGNVSDIPADRADIFRICHRWKGRYESAKKPK